MQVVSTDEIVPGRIVSVMGIAYRITGYIVNIVFQYPDMFGSGSCTHAMSIVFGKFRRCGSEIGKVVQVNIIAVNNDIVEGIARMSIDTDPAQFGVANGGVIKLTGIVRTK